MREDENGAMLTRRRANEKKHENEKEDKTGEWVKWLMCLHTI